MGAKNNLLAIKKIIFFYIASVKPQERKELCGGREGQTTYYVERKALRCDPGKATLPTLCCLRKQLQERPSNNIMHHKDST